MRDGLLRCGRSRLYLEQSIAEHLLYLAQIEQQKNEKALEGLARPFVPGLSYSSNCTRVTSTSHDCGEGNPHCKFRSLWNKLETHSHGAILFSCAKV